jgi:hypothetical protein
MGDRLQPLRGSGVVPGLMFCFVWCADLRVLKSCSVVTTLIHTGPCAGPAPGCCWICKRYAFGALQTVVCVSLLCAERGEVCVQVQYSVKGNSALLGGQQYSLLHDMQL